MSHINKDGQLIKSFTRMGDYTIYQVTHNLLDVFWGIGFVNHARFKWGGGSFTLWKKNKSLPNYLEKTLLQYKKMEQAK